MTMIKNDNSEFTVRTILYTPDTMNDKTQTIYIMKGLPGSGKSTEAKRMADESKGQIVRFNKDNIREMIRAKYTKKSEKLVNEVSREGGIAALKGGMSIIIDDTNFNQTFIDFWLVKAMELQCQVIELFLDVPVKECIRRDQHRETMVGAAVINGFYKKYLAVNDKTIQRYADQDRKLPGALIVDLDGTLTIHGGRGAFEYHKVAGDKPNMPVVRLVQMYINAGFYPIFVTGREDTGDCRVDSTDWILRMFPKLDALTLHMRPNKDFRKDYVIKKEVYDLHIKGKYFVEVVLEDRNSVVDLYRKELQLPCLQVNYGDF